MKRKILLLSVLGVTYGLQAQVGINKSDPKATLDITVKDDNVNNENLDGLLIPRVSKEKAYKMGNNNEIQESTLIYVNDLSTSFAVPDDANKAKVENITSNGYYFWNGAKWIKQAGKDVGEWIYNPTNQRIELVRSGQGDFKNKILYDERGFFKNYDAQNFEVWDYTTNQYKTFDIYDDAQGNFSMGFIKNLKSTAGGVYNSSVLIANQTSNTDGYYANFSANTYTKRNDAIDYSVLVGGSFGVEHNSNGNVKNISGGRTSAYLRNNATSDEVEGLRSTTVLQDNSFPKSAMAYKAVVISRGSSKTYSLIGLHNVISFSKDALSTVTDVNGVRVTTVAYENNASKITNFRGFYYIPNWKRTYTNTISIDNEFGIYLEDVNNGRKSNYAIYTGLGDIRFGQFKKEGAPAKRSLAVDADGKLVIGDATGMGFLWQKDPSNNSVVLATNSAGATRTNDVAITDEGVLVGNGFKGVLNGATVFPDYVFENYYQGESTLKSDYSFKSLSQVEDFVKANGHLPGYLSAKTVKEEGVDVIKTQLTNVEKIEELYLHTIEQEKKIEKQSKEIEELKSLVKQLLNK
ncbi:hypothetical protein KRX57_03390 [Weeksellaceae bacterium TAE3-ERU29]|nr:hypothetical protein [Weeksellaceae bacterium TAE3-ERU29]